MSGDCINNKFREETAKLAKEPGVLKSGADNLLPVQTNKVTSIRPAMEARESLRVERPLAELQTELTELKQRIAGVHGSLAERVATSLEIRRKLDSANERQQKAIQRLVECGESVPVSMSKSLSLLQESYLNVAFVCGQLEQKYYVAECEISALEDQRDQLTDDVRRIREIIEPLTDESAQCDPVVNDSQIKRAA